jgi:hypothetical protein
MYRDMDLRFWLEQAEAELKGLGRCGARDAGGAIPPGPRTE